MGHPKIVPPSPRGNLLQNEPDFSLVLGGPLYQLYLRARLARPPLKLAARRMLVISLVCWLPLLFLAAFAGRLTAGVTDPFLLDPEVHVRFLVVLPLLIAAEVPVHKRIRSIVAQFLERGIITRQNQPRFEKLVDSAMRLRNSVTAELVLLILVTTLGYWLWRQTLALPVSSWYAANAAAGLHLTAAGSYYAFVSLTIFRFILFRWYFRLFIWYRFLWQVRRLPLHLNLYHPDRNGGLGFLADSLPAFAPVFIAQSAALSASVFAHILYAGQKLPAFNMEIAGAILFFILVVIFPMAFFALQLEKAGRMAKHEFGALASRYVDDFRQKWVQSGVRTEEALLGTADIQSLADLGNSYQVVREMRFLTITKESLFRLVAMITLPFLPLILTMFPLTEVIQRLFKLVF